MFASYLRSPGSVGPAKREPAAARQPEAPPRFDVGELPRRDGQASKRRYRQAVAAGKVTPKPRAAALAAAKAWLEP